MKKRMVAAASISLGVMALFQAGCTTVSKPAAKPAADPAAAQNAPQPADYEVRELSGKVAESMYVAGYTYLKVEKDGKATWAAVSGDPKVEVGKEVEVKKGMVLKNFTSKSLNRKFDEIIFSDGLVAHDQAPPISMQAIGGKVAETMDAGGYSYARLEKDGKSVWVALPVMQLKVGQEIDIENAMPMKSFSSKSLNRTFDVIYFASGIKGGQPAGGQAMPPGHPPIGK